MSKFLLIENSWNFNYFLNILIVPNKPKNLKLIKSGIDRLEFSIEITENEKHCNSSVIEVMCGDVTSEEIVNIIKSEYFVQLSNLTPATEYSCSTRVRNSIGVSPSTETELFSTRKNGESHD